MKKKLISLLLFLLIANSAFTQTTYVTQSGDTLITITRDQLVQTNLIFLEHTKLLYSDSLKSLIIEDYQKKVNNYEQIEQARQSQVILYTNELISTQNKLESAVKDMKNKLKVSNYIAIGALSVLIGLILVK